MSPAINTWVFLSDVQLVMSSSNSVTSNRRRRRSMGRWATVNASNEEAIWVSQRDLQPQMLDLIAAWERALGSPDRSFDEYANSAVFD